MLSKEKNSSTLYSFKIVFSLVSKPIKVKLLILVFKKTFKTQSYERVKRQCLTIRVYNMNNMGHSLQVSKIHNKQSLCAELISAMVFIKPFVVHTLIKFLICFRVIKPLRFNRLFKTVHLQQSKVSFSFSIQAWNFSQLEWALSMSNIISCNAHIALVNGHIILHLWKQKFVLLNLLNFLLR